MPGVEELEWVSEQQQDRLAQLAAERGDWRSWLPAELDQRWPQWRDATEDVLVPWFVQVLDELTGAEGIESDSEETHGEQQNGVASLEWVTADQRMYLDQLTTVDGDWHDWLPVKLDEAWPEWRYADPATLANWLGGWLPSLAPAAASTQSTPAADASTGDAPPTGASAPDSTAASSDVSDLAWVSPQQAAALDTLTDTRGDWRTWLPLELDQLGSWRQSAPEALGPWLDQIIPLYVLPADAAEPSSAGAPATDRAPAAEDTSRTGDQTTGDQTTGDQTTSDQSTKEQLTGEQQAQADTFASAVVAAVQENSEMAEILGNLTPEQLAEVLADVAAAVQ